MVFLELTKRNYNSQTGAGGGSIWIESDRILGMEELKGSISSTPQRTLIKLTDGTSIEVMETPDEIQKIIKSAEEKASLES